MSILSNFQVIADNFTYFMIGRWPDGPLGGVDLTIYLAVASCGLSFFGGLFLGYAVYRHLYPGAFAAGSRELSVVWGGFNTVVLILSSLTVALAVREVPEVNGFYVDGAFRPAERVHLGVAISLRQGGLVAPALHDVDQKPLAVLMRDLDDLVTRTRRGGLRSSELADATLTVTSLGDLGVATVYGVIYPPQVALVGFGRVQERPWVSDGRVEARPVVAATLSGDHRVSDGIRGARFLAALDRLLQAPEGL